MDHIRKPRWPVVILVLAGAGISACREDLRSAPGRGEMLARIADGRSSSAQRIPARAGAIRYEPIQLVPQVPQLDPRRVQLGRRLFHDVRLSGGGDTSCATCHDIGANGTDLKQRRVELNGRVDTFDTPTIFNVSLNPRQFWDGRARSLEEQVDGPLLNSVEMATTWPKVLAFLSTEPTYAAEFATAFSDGVTADNVRTAISDFERSLLTPGSRFDRYLLGELALTDAEAHGYELFKDYGCSSCHQGSNVGGNMFERMGVMADYFDGRDERKEDLGRFNATGRAEDRHVFRVPSLRLAVRTPPYFHDGSAATLDEAIELMGRYQLGVAIPQEDRRLIIQFLETLPGEYGGRQL